MVGSLIHYANPAWQPTLRQVPTGMDLASDHAIPEDVSLPVAVGPAPDSLDSMLIQSWLLGSGERVIAGSPTSNARPESPLLTERPEQAPGYGVNPARLPYRYLHEV